LQARSSDFTQTRSSLQALLRKQTGSLAVRDLSGLVPPSSLVSTDNLTTLVAVVPKAARSEWLSSYESLTDFVVPRSSAVVEEDADYAAYMVVLFRRAVDDFKVAARAKGFQAKEVAEAAIEAGSSDGPPAAPPQSSDKVLETLRTEVEGKRAALVDWCLTSYGEAFTSWVHVIAVRLFVESILRYGLPPQFLPVLMKPNPRYQSQLRKILAQHFGAVGGQHFTGDGGGGTGEDMFPYVTFSLNIEE